MPLAIARISECRSFVVFAPVSDGFAYRRFLFRFLAWCRLLKSLTPVHILAPTSSQKIVKLNYRKLLRLAATGTIGGALVNSVHAETLLQFGGTFDLGANDSAMEEDYGDNVSASDAETGVVATAGVQGVVGTPGITLEYNPNSGPGFFDSYPAWDGRGSVLQTQYDNGDLNLEFTPSASVGVLITSFDLDEYAGGGATVVNWSITNVDTTAVIVSGVWNDFEIADGGSSTVATGMTEAQALANVGSVLSLNLVLAGGTGSYQALDNLVFDQVVVTDSFVASLESDKEYIENPVTLTWTIANPDSEMEVTLDDGTTQLNVTSNTNLTTGEGTIIVNPTENTTYTLLVNGGNSRELTLITGEALSLSPNPVLATSPSYETTLSWEIRPIGAGLVTLFDGTNTIDVTADTDALTGFGSRVVTVSEPATTFEIDVNNSGSTRSAVVLRQQENSAAFSINSASLNTNGTLTVSWTGAAAGETDWVAIYRANATPGDVFSYTWNYLNGSQTAGPASIDGSVQFSDLEAGDYYVVLLLNDGYEVAQGPILFTVTEAPVVGGVPIVSIVRTGSDLTLTWESNADSEYDIYGSETMVGDPLDSQSEWDVVEFGVFASGTGTTAYTEDLSGLAGGIPARRFYIIYEYPSGL